MDEGVEEYRVTLLEVDEEAMKTLTDVTLTELSADDMRSTHACRHSSVLPSGILSYR